jgi:hypothetical protein
MSFTHQIDVELVNNTASPENQINSPSQSGDYTINIQAAEGWNITGKYRHNELQAITVNKRTHKEGKA